MSPGATGRPAAAPPWDLTFLKVGAVAASAVTAVAAPVTGLVAGWPDAIGVLLGAVVVTAFFCLSGLVVAWAGRVADAFTLPAALGMFFVKAVVLFGVLDALPEDGWMRRTTLAWAVVAGALLWSAVQLRWVWTRKLYYVPPPAPPAPPGPPDEGSAAAPRVLPENPATRG